MTKTATIDRKRKRLEDMAKIEMNIIEAEYELMRLTSIEVLGGDLRLSQLRRSRGVIGALVYLVTENDGANCLKLHDAGWGERSAEAIIGHHPKHFSKKTVQLARARRQQCMTGRELGEQQQ